jgi:hypothetical protein
MPQLTPPDPCSRGLTHSRSRSPDSCCQSQPASCRRCLGCPVGPTGRLSAGSGCRSGQLPPEEPARVRCCGQQPRNSVQRGSLGGWGCPRQTRAPDLVSECGGIGASGRAPAAAATSRSGRLTNSAWSVTVSFDLRRLSTSRRQSKPGLPDFSWFKHTKTVQIYQLTTNALKYTK